MVLSARDESTMSDDALHLIDQLKGPSPIDTPHHHQERANDTIGMFPNNLNLNTEPRSTKRKRNSEDLAYLPSVKLQTSGLDTPKSHRVHDALDYEDSLSPRTIVSARFQSLNLQSQATESPMPETKTKRRASWTVPVQVPASKPEGPAHSDQQPLRNVGVPPILKSAVKDTPECSVQVSGSGTKTVNVPTESSLVQAKHDVEHAMYHFSTGSQEDVRAKVPDIQPGDLELPQQQFSSPDQHHASAPSPSKRRRRRSTSKSPSRSPRLRSSLGQVLDTSDATISPPTSVATRRLSSPPPRKNRSDSSLSNESDNDIASLWWQDSEIVGHDPADPEDDSRGVNGIGYQKTKAEQYRISERKKRQITEWRNREAREARAIRAAGRVSGNGSGPKDLIDKGDKGHRVILGRVTKSRSGSPVERRAAEVEPRSPSKKGVRFKAD